MHAAVLRLPRPHLAQPSVHDAPLVGVNMEGNDLTKPTPFSRRNLFSDSDDEDSYTAVDHDRRLVYVLSTATPSRSFNVFQ